MSAVDDVMPNAYEEPWDVVTADVVSLMVQVVTTCLLTLTVIVRWCYCSVLKASDAVTDVSYSDIGLTYTGIDGLTLGYAQGDVEQTTATKSDEHTMYLKYAMGPITVGVQSSEKDEDGGATNDTESTGVGLTYQVNDDLSVGIGSHTIEYNSGDDQESTGFSASYTMGSLTIAGAYNSVDNIANTSTDDRSAYELSFGFAF